MDECRNMDPISPFSHEIGMIQCAEKYDETAVILQDKYIAYPG